MNTWKKMFTELKEKQEEVANDLLSVRKEVFGDPEDNILLEKFRPYEVVLRRKAQWLNLLPGSLFMLESAREEAVVGGAEEAQGPVRNWASVVTFGEMESKCVGGIAKASSKDQMKDVINAARQACKLAKERLKDVNTSILKLKKASNPEPKVKAKAKPKDRRAQETCSKPSLAAATVPPMLSAQLFADAEISRAQLDAASGKPAEPLTGDLLVAMDARELVGKLLANREFSLVFQAFRKDVAAEKDAAGLPRKFRAIPGDSEACEVAAAEMEKLLPSWSLEVKEDELKSHCDPSLLKSTSQYMVRKSIMLGAMRKDTCWSGREWLGFPTLRVHTHGFRIILAFKMEEIRSCMPNGALASQEHAEQPTAQPDSEVKKEDAPENAPEMHQWDQIDQAMQIATGDTITQLFKLEGFRHGTFGPGSMLLLPPGYVIMEKALGLSSLCIKRNLIPMTPDMITGMKKRLSSTRPLSRSGLCTLDISDKVLAARTAALGVGS